jgi:release factor glutamine methyltransferase
LSESTPSREARPQTVLEILRASESWLADRGVEGARRSAEWLLAHVLGVDRLHVYLAHDRPLDESERDRLRELVFRRGNHEPLGYLLGTQPFRTLDLEVGPGVLVPRPETEELVDVARSALGTSTHPRILDLGTGSGCLALSLASEIADAEVVATDRSAEALAYARRNAERAGVASRVDFREGSWWEAIAQGERFDLVVSNPPYVDPDGPDPVDPGVREHEPALALFTPPGDPGACYREIGRGLSPHLTDDGVAVFETGGNAVDAGAEALRETCPGAQVEILTDLAGFRRYVRVRGIA